MTPRFHQTPPKVTSAPEIPGASVNIGGACGGVGTKEPR